MAMVGTSREDHGHRVLKEATLEVYGNMAEALMDSGTIPNVM